MVNDCVYITLLLHHRCFKVFLLLIHSFTFMHSLTSAICWQSLGVCTTIVSNVGFSSAQGLFHMWTGGVRDRTTNLLYILSHSHWKTEQTLHRWIERLITSCQETQSSSFFTPQPLVCRRLASVQKLVKPSPAPAPFLSLGNFENFINMLMT